MTNDEQKRLIAAAVQARQHAYAKYSNFQVGAALQTYTGELFTGCNVENASYGLTICAERVAICSAVAAGFQKFTAIAIVTAGGMTPCGACRQFMVEFAGDLIVLIADASDLTRVKECKLSELLPDSFRLAE